jgi:hypothetical protein
MGSAYHFVLCVRQEPEQPEEAPRKLHCYRRFASPLDGYIPFYLKNTLICCPLSAWAASHRLNVHKARNEWHPTGAIGSFQAAAQAAGWKSPEQVGKWVKVTRTFRDGSSQDWWALGVIAGPYGPAKQERVVIATTDPTTLPNLTAFYLVTNLPAPGSQRAAASELAAASLEEVVRLYGLRMWVEQSYKQVKRALGWSQYQVRSDRAMRRHWQLVCCAFSFCWYHASHLEASTMQEAKAPSEPEVPPQPGVPASSIRTGGKNQRGKGHAATAALAEGAAGGARMVGAVDHAAALLAWLVSTAPTSCIATPASLA